MRIEQQRGSIYTTASSGKEQIQARGHVDFGVLIDSISKLGLSEKQASRIKKIITVTGDQIWNLMRTGGVITTNGEIIMQGEGNGEFLDSFFAPESEKSIAVARGAKFEAAAQQAGKNNLYLSPSQKVLILKRDISDKLETYTCKSGACYSIFKPTKDDRTEYDGLVDTQALISAIKNRFAQVFSQTGIPHTGVISPETLSKHLVINIVEKSKINSEG